MYLLIDTISLPAMYILFNAERNIIGQENLDIKGRESEHFFSSLLKFLKKNNQNIDCLEGIIVVNGPGSFTAMRIITLTINTLSLVHHTPLYAIDYFVLSELSMRGYPVLLRANQGEYMMQKKKHTLPKLLAISDIPPGNYFGIGDINDFTNGTIFIQSTLRYDIICKNFNTANSVPRIEPLYIKKPNIT